tara:strand:- start:251 stop:454 length:204 start_codon:yes stop_codon:yes gene_type:complete
MKDPKFIKGEKITVKDDTGKVNFISDEYITLTTHQWEKKDTLHGYQQTNVLVYRNDWKDIVYHDRDK